MHSLWLAVCIDCERMGAHARAMPSSSSSDWQLGFVLADRLGEAISQVGFVPIVGQPPQSGPPPHSYPLTPGLLYDALVANATSAALAANPIRRPDALLANAASAILAFREPTDAVVAKAASDALVAKAALAGLAADCAFADLFCEADFTDGIDFEDMGKGKKRKSSAAGGGLHIVVETGAWEDIWDFQVQEDDKIIDVKNQIWNVLGWPSDGEVVLSYEGTILIDTFTLRDYEVKNNSRFYLTWADDDDV